MTISNALQNAMAANKTILSAGSVIRAALLKDPTVTDITNKVYGVMANKADLPYVVYRLASLDSVQTKSAPANSGLIELDCFGKTYAQAVSLAEAVRAALDGYQFTHEGLRLRSCSLVNAEDIFTADAYGQMLTFRIKI